MPRKPAVESSAAAVVDELDYVVDIPPAARAPKIQKITRSQIHPDPEQPREAADAELRASIARNGLLQPITVRPHPSIMTEWMIVDGERRWLSCDGVIEDIPCIVRHDMETIARRLATQLEANTGKALKPLEEARAFGKLIDDTGMSVSDLAQFLGRAKSTVGERVALLELGPWLPLIENGTIVLSHAVKALLPFRALADEVHAAVIEQLQEEEFFVVGDAEITLDEFSEGVKRAFRTFLYPLRKSKAYGARNPEFNTSKHDTECACGTIQLREGYPAIDRVYCGNPEWWKPRDAAGVKARREKEKKEKLEAKGATASSGKTLYLPASVKTIKSDYGSAPKGVVQLTDSNGEWYVSRNGSEGAYDPSDLVFNDEDLVRWETYGQNYPVVGTKNLAAIDAARERWQARWDAERTEIAEELGALLREQSEGYSVDGGGSLEIVALLGEDATIEAADVGLALGWNVPLPLVRATEWKKRDLARDWLASLSLSEASVLLSSLATVHALKLILPSDEIERRQEKALAAIKKRTIPWKTKPKAQKVSAPKKASTANITFMKPMFPSPALARVVGAKEITRVDVTKKLWAYIKKHKLQGKGALRREINADAALQAVFEGKKVVSMFEMTKLVNKNLAGTAEAAALIGTGKRSPKIPLEQLSEVTAELPLDDPRVEVDESWDDEDDDESAVGAPVGVPGDDDQDLWDSTDDDELEDEG